MVNLGLFLKFKMLSVGYSQWGRARLAEIPRVLAQKRHASYSKVCSNISGLRTRGGYY